MATRKDEREPAEQPTEAVIGEQAAQAAEAGAQGAERVRRTGEQAAETGSRIAGRGMQQGMQQAVEFSRRSSDQMRSLATAGTRAYRDMTDFSRGDVDALMQTGARLAKGMQDMGLEVMQFTQQSMRLSIKTANDLMGCRSVEDMMQVSSDYMRESVDTFLQESARLLELSSSVADEAVSPLNARIPSGTTRH